jgi:hypothetical protein
MHAVRAVKPNDSFRTTPQRVTSFCGLGLSQARTGSAGYRRAHRSALVLTRPNAFVRSTVGRRQPEIAWNLDPAKAFGRVSSLIEHVVRNRIYASVRRRVPGGKQPAALAPKMTMSLVEFVANSSDVVLRMIPEASTSIGFPPTSAAPNTQSLETPDGSCLLYRYLYPALSIPTST